MKSLAKELAGAFYEQKRSGRFRSVNELVKAKTLKRLPDGRHVEVTVRVPFRKAYPSAQAFSSTHWPFFVDAARRCMTTMLALPDARVAPHLKAAIYDALLEDNDKRQNHLTGGLTLAQSKALPYVDAT